MWSKSTGYLRAAQVTGEQGGLAQRVALVVGQVQGLHHTTFSRAHRRFQNGTVGGGGIGDLAITYGYQRFDAFATLTTALVLIVIVQLIQTLGTRLARRLRRE
ncbi:hypothetical protein SE02_06990 [Klebsiella pneumoniae]|nr:hypothetical protein SE02_06990 [Klebsiella pneumoniae]